MKNLWILGFLVNIFLLGSVFDIYFKSPIVKVDKTHESDVPTRFKRLVFFVADGLRADTFFEYPELRPRLKYLMEYENNVAWGISDTRVPTESRPGHIALFAGFYEDPSAVFTGWKNNLVEFDSVFNRTQSSVAFGSPDVVSMFAQGAAKSKIYSETYPSDWQDFLAENSTMLDTWVFDRFKYLADSQEIPRHDNLLVFLHLLGIDNTGHATKPHSKEYKDGLTVVDDIVAKVEKILDRYYDSDNKTLFVFTSDHGMTDWGSHGSGSKQETETPFVIWGRGIKPTQNLRLKQADFASLIAGALGSPFPTNSVGKFPTDIWWDETFSYSCLKANVWQLKELMETKKLRVKSERNFPLIEFPDEKELSESYVTAEGWIVDEEYINAIKHLETAFNIAYNGNFYYERYDQQLLKFFSTWTFILLMGLVAVIVLKMDQEHKDDSQIFSLKLSFLAGVLSIICIKGVIGWSLFRIGYVFVPVYLGLLIVSEFFHGGGKKIQNPLGQLNPSRLIWGIVLCLLGVQMLVLSFSERSVLSLALVLNLCWALKGHPKGKIHLLMYFTAVGTLALFPALRIIGNSHSPFFKTVGPLVSALIVGFVLGFFGSKITSQRDKVLLSLQLMILVSSAFLLHFPTFLPTRIAAWMSLAAFIGPTLISSRYICIRLLSVYMALSSPFSFLGISYETLFFPSLFVVLLLILKLEVDGESDVEEGMSFHQFFTLEQQDSSTTIHNRRNQINVHRTFRRAWFHLFFVFLSFFGTGNIDSVSSFDPSSTRCFVSIFNPWLMMVLMLTKILCPFLLVSCFWRALLPQKIHVERNFGILLLFCQGMSLAMFFKVTNQGSWLQIGTSISHFVIVQSTTLFLFLLHFIANFLVTFEFMQSRPKLLPNSGLSPAYKATKGH